MEGRGRGPPGEALPPRGGPPSGKGPPGEKGPPVGEMPIQASPRAKAVFDYWTSERIASAVPRDYEIESTTGERKLRTRALQNVVADDNWTAGGNIANAAGRLFFTMGGSRYVCSGTVVSDNGTPDRSLIVTAAHCVYDEDTDTFGYNFLFIPRQDDGGTDRSNSACSDDPFGCWVPEFAVVDSRWRDGVWSSIIPYDYAILVVPDYPDNHSAGYENAGNHVLDSAVTPMEVDFANEQNLENDSTGQFMGYSYNKDPKFRFCRQPLVARSDRWVIPGCMLSGGSSGGPCQPDPQGNGKLFSVISYSYSSNGEQVGMGGARLDSSGFSCVYSRAVMAPLESTGEVISLFNGEACPTAPSCPFAESELVITITTDNYPGETSWKLVNDFTLDTIASVTSYSVKLSTNTHTFCLPSAESFTFTIEDSWGDVSCIVLYLSWKDHFISIRGSHAMNVPFYFPTGDLLWIWERELFPSV